MKIIRNSDIQISNWSGGTTSELYIYPENSNYKSLDFNFRLSKATIEVEESIFTPLPNVKRKLMLLDGELELIHQNHHKKKLVPFEYDTFSGSWNTKSIGKATDFNLMMLGDTEGEYKVLSTIKEAHLTYTHTADISVLYVANGNIKINNTLINKGELIIFDTKQTCNETLILGQNSNVISIEIYL